MKGDQRTRQTTEATGKWLQKALVELCQRVDALDLDEDVISDLVSHCEQATPLDAKEHLDNIIGKDTGKHVIDEYLVRRGLATDTRRTAVEQQSNFHTYIKPPLRGGSVTSISGTKKPAKARSIKADEQGGQGTLQDSKKKVAGKSISLADLDKGNVFRQGRPCSCQARKHALVTNCLSCGKIVCEQEGEGPCSFCGALVLKEGSTYAGLEQGSTLLSDAEVAAKAYAKRLLEYDHNSAARTTVIDDQSDYYEIDSNRWLSHEEKDDLRKKQEKTEEDDKARRDKVVVTLDLVGRKVVLNQDEVSEMESENRILRPLSDTEREMNRVKPNPNLKIRPTFIDQGPCRQARKENRARNNLSDGFCLNITGRVQHDFNEWKYFLGSDPSGGTSNHNIWQNTPSITDLRVGEDASCSSNHTW